MKCRAFTLIELLVVITIIGMLAAIALPNYLRAKDKAKETQTIANIHTLQTAVERYSVDQGEFPLFLLGGDVEGWRNWHSRSYSGVAAYSVAALNDPLIYGGYLASYPKNPFVDNGLSIISSTGNATSPTGEYQAGDGDPRFGFQGDIIGNGIENPMLHKNWYSDKSQSIETYLTLYTVTDGNPEAKGFAGRYANGLYYNMGGHRRLDNGTFDTVYAFWPGQFFYRGFPERLLIRKGWTIYFPHVFIKAETNRYFMGAYGSYQSSGKDVVRLESVDPTGSPIFYRLPPPWIANNGLIMLGFDNNAGFPFKFGLPELVGGGDAFTGPYLPPNANPDYPNEFILGAPDGCPDGIIAVLSSGDLLDE